MQRDKRRVVDPQKTGKPFSLLLLGSGCRDLVKLTPLKQAMGKLISFNKMDFTKLFKTAKCEEAPLARVGGGYRRGVWFSKFGSKYHSGHRMGQKGYFG